MVMIPRRLARDANISVLLLPLPPPPPRLSLVLDVLDVLRRRGRCGIEGWVGSIGR